MKLSTKKYLYWGLGSMAATVIVLIVIRRNNTKVDLSKFDSPDEPGSGQCMDKQFIKMLKRIAVKTGYPIFDWINSGVRSETWNKKVGGVKNSAHKVCKAADIKAPTTAIRNKIVKTAKQVGFKRIGIANTFVHLDVDETKRQYVAWGYPAGKKPPFNPFA